MRVPSLQEGLCYRAFTVMIEQLKDSTGDEILAIMSYCMNNAAKPPIPYEQNASLVARIFYERPIPAGSLPFDLTTKQFI